MNITKVLGIDEISFDKNYYPRIATHWVTTLNYKSAMRTGIIFPPITVGRLGKKYYLIDGKHRIDAYKNLKQDSVECEVIKLKSKNEILLEAIKRNITHGQAFQANDKERLIEKLKVMKYSFEDISSILQILIHNIKIFGVSKITSTLVTEKMKSKDSMSSYQQGYSSDSPQSVWHIMDLFLGLLDSSNITGKQKKKYIKKLKTIYGKLGEVLNKPKKVAS